MREHKGRDAALQQQRQHPHQQADDADDEPGEEKEEAEEDCLWSFQSSYQHRDAQPTTRKTTTIIMKFVAAATMCVFGFSQTATALLDDLDGLSNFAECSDCIQAAIVSVLCWLVVELRLMTVSA